MDRNEVLAALSRAEVDYVKVQAESQTVWEFQDAEWKARAFRAAAELIRAGGWMPIAEAPGVGELRVGCYCRDRWFRPWYGVDKAYAIAHGYTHYLPEPAPPAREVENDRV